MKRVFGRLFGGILLGYFSVILGFHAWRNNQAAMLSDFLPFEFVPRNVSVPLLLTNVFFGAVSALLAILSILLLCSLIRSRQVTKHADKPSK